MRTDVRATDVRATSVRAGVRSRMQYRCAECGAVVVRWLGRCTTCGAWGSLAEEPSAPEPPSAVPTDRPVPIAELAAPEGPRHATGVAELDRVLGGGLVAGSVTVLSGEPGIGKSTLLLQAVANAAAAGATALLVTAEESKEQVRARAGRLGTVPSGLLVVAETSLSNVLAHIEGLHPDLVALDSIQTVVDPDQTGASGSVTQVRDCAQRLVRVAKERTVTMLLSGHVTKEGGLAGPRALEHVVDTVLAFEGDRHHCLRLLRALKHRYGPTSELGVLEMTGEGLRDVPDPSALFLADRRAGAPGSVVAPVLEGARPLLVEVQALVGRESVPMARRAAQGLDAGRLGMILAVLDQRVGLRARNRDVWASVAGGIRVDDAGADLALLLAVAGASTGQGLPPDTVAIGEVGLCGEVRQAAQTPRRLAEAARLGFRRAIIAASAAPAPGVERVAVADVGDALRAIGLVHQPAPA